jgi:hypothetical protein
LLHSLETDRSLPGDPASMDERFRGASLFDAADDLMVASNGLPVDLSLSGLKLAPFNGKPKGIAADVPRKGKVLLKPALDMVRCIACVWVYGRM